MKFYDREAKFDAFQQALAPRTSAHRKMGEHLSLSVITARSIDGSILDLFDLCRIEEALFLTYKLANLRNFCGVLWGLDIPTYHYYYYYFFIFYFLHPNPFFQIVDSAK